jgi:glycine betaine/proline transport system permease protein
LPESLRAGCVRISEGHVVKLAKWISAAMKWLIDEASFGLFSFTDLTRFIAAVLDVPYTLAASLLVHRLSGRQRLFGRPDRAAACPGSPSSAWSMLLGHWLGGTPLALLSGGCFAVPGRFRTVDQRDGDARIDPVAAPLGVTFGLLFGIAAWRWRWLERMIMPLLDLMQTIPVFAYLVPVLFLFGFGPTAASLPR